MSFFGVIDIPMCDLLTVDIGSKYANLSDEFESFPADDVDRDTKAYVKVNMGVWCGTHSRSRRRLLANPLSFNGSL